MTAQGTPDAVEAIVEEALKKRLAGKILIDPTRPHSLDYEDDETRMLIETNWMSLHKLRRTNTQLFNYIPPMESYASGLSELPAPIDDLVEQRILAEVTLDDEFRQTLNASLRAKTLWAGFLKHLPMMTAIAAIALVGGLAVFRITEPAESQLLIDSIANIDWLHASLILGAAGAVGLLGFLAWRSHRKNQNQPVARSS